jgi:hypothetical protein
MLEAYGRHLVPAQFLAGHDSAVSGEDLAPAVAFVIRPHTASRTSKGIANAFALSRELAERKTLSESLRNWQISDLARGCS